MAVSFKDALRSGDFIVTAEIGPPKGGALQKGIEIASRMIRRIKEEGIAHGVHIMAIGKETVVPDILQAANL